MEMLNIMSGTNNCHAGDAVEYRAFLPSVCILKV
jgi:hypothetical protein